MTATELAKIGREQLWNRLLARAIPEPMSGCLLWLGALNSDGYGNIKINGKNYRVPRLSFLIHKGKIKKGKQVRHSCDNPICFEPNHLLEGTRSQNRQDCISRGRLPKSQRKFSPDQISEIRKSESSDTALAKKYKVARNTIYQIKKGISYYANVR